MIGLRGVLVRANLRSALGLGQVIAARVINSAGSIVLSIVISRAAGVSTLGSVTFALTTVSMLGVLGRAGFDTCLIKKMLVDRAKGTTGGLYKALGHALRRSAMISSGLTLAALVGMFVVPETWEDLFAGGHLFFGAILPMALFAIAAAYARGADYVTLSAAMDIGLLSFVTAIVVAVQVWVWGVGLTPSGIAVVFLIVAILFAFLSIMWSLGDARKLAAGNSGEFERATFERGAPLFTIVNVIGFATQAGSFVLAGFFLDSTEMGFARAAERLALFVSFPLIAVNLFISSRIIHHKTLAQSTELRRLVHYACLASGSLGLPMAIILVLFPTFSLQLLGPEFGAARMLLLVFVGTQLITAFTGPYSMLLYLAGQERLLSQIMIFTLALSVVIYPIGCLWAGATGFAIAYLVLNTVRSALLVWSGELRVLMWRARPAKALRA